MQIKTGPEQRVQQSLSVLVQSIYDLAFRKILLSSEITRQLVGYIDVNCWQHMDSVAVIATMHAQHLRNILFQFPQKVS
jgi:hypothetical protein